MCDNFENSVSHFDVNRFSKKKKYITLFRTESTSRRNLQCHCHHKLNVQFHTVLRISSRGLQPSLQLLIENTLDGLLRKDDCVSGESFNQACNSWLRILVTVSREKLTVRLDLARLLNRRSSSLMREEPNIVECCWLISLLRITPPCSIFVTRSIWRKLFGIPSLESWRLLTNFLPKQWNLKRPRRWRRVAVQ